MLRFVKSIIDRKVHIFRLYLFQYDEYPQAYFVWKFKICKIPQRLSRGSLPTFYAIMQDQNN